MFELNRVIWKSARRGLGLWLCALLAACAAHAPQNQDLARFRDPSHSIYSAAAFDMSRALGQWRQVAYFQAPRQGAGDAAAAHRCGQDMLLRLGHTAGSGPLWAQGQLCLNGAQAQINAPIRLTGPGRLGVAGMSDWWVIWVDSGYRTMAIATPDGAFGFVLERGQVSTDRLRAAREIFDFNGYDVRQLRQN